MADVSSRSRIIEALSWEEDMDRGRWGGEYATEVLEAHEARIEADGLRRAADEVVISGASSIVARWLRERADRIQSTAQPDAMCETCGMPKSRCDTWPERSGEAACCSHCDHGATL